LTTQIKIQSLEAPTSATRNLKTTKNLGQHVDKTSMFMLNFFFLTSIKYTRNYDGKATVNKIVQKCTRQVGSTVYTCIYQKSQFTPLESQFRTLVELKTS